MAEDTSIAADFIKVAEDIATYRREQREAEARKQFGQRYDDFSRELSLVADAIGALPPSIGTTFRVHMPRANDRQRFDFTVDCDRPARGGTITYSFSLWMDRDKITVDNEWRCESGENKFDRTSRTTAADFAEVRKKLAVWFGDIAPGRIAELKNILMPEDAVMLKRDVRTGGPIRLKATESQP